MIIGGVAIALIAVLRLFQARHVSDTTRVTVIIIVLAGTVLSFLSVIGLPIVLGASTVALWLATDRTDYHDQKPPRSY